MSGCPKSRSRMRDEWRRSDSRDRRAPPMQTHAEATAAHTPASSQTHAVAAEQTLDTDIGNYNLKDILQLFKMPADFGEADLRRAKRTTMKTHPDTSRLPGDYFRFFCAAYRMLEQIYEFRHSKRLRERELTRRDSALYMNTKYETETDKEKELLLRDITKKDDFNEWFNEMFAKAKAGGGARDEETERGYEGWLRSNEGLDEGAPSIKQNQMDAYFEERKAKAAREYALTRHRGVQECRSGGGGGGMGGSELDRSGADVEYASGVFDKLRYDDLRRAHTESVIPVSTHEELARRPHFASVDDYVSFRDGQNVMAMSESETKEQLARMATRNSELETQRAFNILKQDEEAQRRQEEWWSTLRTIRHAPVGAQPLR